jgi:bifunctional ADP-heptose synthase (sugar kinase/adenylyltransferase)
MIERVVDEPRFSKIAQIYNNPKIILNRDHEKKILKLLKTKSKETFFVIDFGIGIFTQNIVNFFNKSNVKYFLNCHLNSINAKYAYFEKFKKFKYITFNKREFEFSFKGNEALVDKIKKARVIIKSDFAVTIGFRGSYLINKQKISHSPAIYKKIIDPVGCGDAYFAMTSLLKNVTNDLDLINFLGNLYAGMHGMFICNEKFVNKRDFLNTVKTILS